MAVEYRFTGTNIDATLVTDAPTGSRTFFVTERRGHDPADVMAGIDTEIQEYHEADFVILATDLNLHLDRLDRNGTFCLVVQAAAAGRFNGRTSVLAVDNVPLATSGAPNYPITIRATWRLNQNDLVALQNSCPPFAIVGTNIAVMDRFDLSLRAGPSGPPGEPGGVIVVNFSLVVGGNFITDLQYFTSFMPTDMCMVTEVRLFEEDGTPFAALIINGETQNQQRVRDLTFSMDDFDLAFGAQPTNGAGGISFQGIMRNLSISTSAGVLVNIVDPSTGVNTGSLPNGTATDIESVGVIV